MSYYCAVAIIAKMSNYAIQPNCGGWQITVIITRDVISPHVQMFRGEQWSLHWWLNPMLFRAFGKHLKLWQTIRLAATRPVIIFTILTYLKIYTDEQDHFAGFDILFTCIFVYTGHQNFSLSGCSCPSALSQPLLCGRWRSNKHRVDSLQQWSSELTREMYSRLSRLLPNDTTQVDLFKISRNKNRRYNYPENASKI